MYLATQKQKMHVCGGFFRALALLLCMAAALGVSAQSIVKGLVTDPSNEPLIGVSVRGENGAGVTTDVDGKFAISVPQAGQPHQNPYFLRRPIK